MKKWIEKRNSCLPREMLYADDADFLTEDPHIKKIIEEKAAPVLKQGNLNVSTTKTEHTILKRGNKLNEKWRKTKKTWIFIRRRGRYFSQEAIISSSSE